MAQKCRHGARFAAFPEREPFPAMTLSRRRFLIASCATAFAATPPPSGGGSGVSGQTGAGDRAVRGGRTERSCRPAIAQGLPTGWASSSTSEHRRRGRQYRYRSGLASGARWAHGALGRAELCGQSLPVRLRALRSAQKLRGGDTRGNRADLADRASLRSGRERHGA